MTKRVKNNIKNCLRTTSMVHFNTSFNENDTLEGKVLVYARFLSSGSEELRTEWGGGMLAVRNGTFLGTYSSMNAEDIARKFGLEGEEALKRARKLEEQAEEIRKKNNHGPKDVSMYKIFVKFDSVQAIEEGDGDVLFMGEFYAINNVKRSIDVGEHLYIVRMHDQIHAKNKKKNEATRAEFKGKSIKDYVLREYVVPLIAAVSAGNAASADGLEQALLLFSQGAGFENDVREMCKKVKSKGEETPKYLLALMIEKIDAIHTEKYECAAELRDEIKNIEENS